MHIKHIFFQLIGIFILLNASCQQPVVKQLFTPPFPHPFSDSTNTGNWILTEEVSDEFEGQQLDDSKWYVTGTDGRYFGWKGRAPSQFAAHNVRVEDGKLKLHSQWEPDFNFATHQQDGRDYENITTAAVICQHKFLYGYMEIKSKAGDAAMTSSFWTTGYQSELDMFEEMGAPKMGQQLKDNYYLFSIHDWRPSAREHQNKVFTYAHKLDYRVADDFHVYGCEWDDDYLKFYADGNLVYTLTKEEMGDNWVVTNPLEIWFDSEVFSWLGIPEEYELPVDFEIEYVRVWQKPDPNLLDRAFYGFEGPIVLEEVRKPEKENKYYKFWQLDSLSSANFSIIDGKFTSGTKSLKFTHNGNLMFTRIAGETPAGSLDIPAGDFILSLKVWLEPGSTLRRVNLILEDPLLQLEPIDLTNLATGEWVNVIQTFSRAEASNANDRLKITVYKDDVPGGISTFYIDEIAVYAIDIRDKKR